MILNGGRFQFYGIFDTFRSDAGGTEKSLKVFIGNTVVFEFSVTIFLGKLFIEEHTHAEKYLHHK